MPGIASATDDTLLQPFAALPDGWALDAPQLRWLSCETLVLCMPVDLRELSERELRALNHTIRSQLGAEAQTAETLAPTLRLEGYDDPHDMQHLQVEPLRRRPRQTNRQTEERGP